MKSHRINLTVSTEVMVALELLSERNGLAETTCAMSVLRTALSRTIDSEECQRRIVAAKAFSTARQWKERVHADALASGREAVKLAE